MTSMDKKLGLMIVVVLVISSIAMSYRVPSAEATIWVEGHITSNTTWVHIPNETYRVINDTYVDPGVTLTIDPGVQVQFADGFSLIVNGSLDAVGTDTQPIVFTSSRVSPSPGVWNAVRFAGDLNSSFLVQHAEVEFAMDGITIGSLGYSRIVSSRITDCSESGILIKGLSNLVIEDNIIERNTNGISTDSSNAQGGIVFARNTLSFNGENGIYLYAYGGSPSVSNVAFSSNTVSSNEQNGIYMNAQGDGPSTYFSNVALSSNNVSSNVGNGIWLSPNCLSSSSYVSDLDFLSNTASCNGQNGIYVSSNSGFGCYFSNLGFSSNTALCNGQNGIYMNTNGDVHTFSSVTHAAFFSNTAISNTGNGMILYAQGYSFSISDLDFSSNTALCNGQNGIYLYSSNYMYNVTLSSNIVSSNKANGIYAQASGHNSQLVYDITIFANIISANYQKAVWIDGGLNSTMSSNSVSYNLYGVFYTTTKNNRANYNDVYRNNYGMNVTNGATVDAEYNYWGDSTGPYQPSLRPEGKGNPVNGNGVDLDFIPFLNSSIGTINERPIAVLEVDKTNPVLNETVAFDATGSTDDGRIDYYFDFGDGTNSSWTSLPVVTHKYSQQRTYNATLIVIDDFGVTSNNKQQAVVQVAVVPEFPSILMLPLFMTTALLVAIVSKKRANALR